LLTIKERASYIGGAFTIESTPRQVSRFTLTVPNAAAIDDEEETASLSVSEQEVKIPIPSKGIKSSTTRVLFVDDRHVMRQGLIKLITGQPGIHMIGEAENGAEALELARHTRPDVIIMDISMPEMDGIEATRRIKTDLPNVRVIGLSMHDDEQLIGAMQQAGAEVVLRKTISTAEMVKAIYGR
jgi:CheY-like chemotaxis protein